MNEQIFNTNSFEQTQMIGKDLGSKLKGGEILALYGDLGSGKTTFVQGVALGLGIKRRIISPTFIIVRKYALTMKNFYHIDLYRIDSERDIEGLGLKEIIDNQENIVAIEWAQKLGSLLSKKRIDIKFEHLDQDKRRITIYG